MKDFIETRTPWTLTHSSGMGNGCITQANRYEQCTSIEVPHHVSFFYQALVATGLIKELHKDQPYTIFSPTDAAFLSLDQALMPLLYAPQNRSTLLDLLRNHIIVGRYDLNDLISPCCVIADGLKYMPVINLSVDDYVVDGCPIISKDEINGNIIYCIDGLLDPRKALPQFRFAQDHPSTQSIEARQVRATYIRAVDVTEAYTSALHQGLSYVTPPSMTESRAETTFSVRTP